MAAELNEVVGAVEQAERQAVAETQSDVLKTRDHHLSPESKTWLRTGATLLGCGAVVGALYGALTPTEIEIGPHRATVQATIDNHVTLDGGPFGSADKSTNMGMGMKIVIKGVPTLPGEPALSAVGPMIEQYGQLLSDPQHIKDSAEHAFVGRIWHDAIWGGAPALLLATPPLGEFMQRRRRKKAAEPEALATIEAMDISAGEKQLLRAAIGKKETSTRRLSRIASAGAVLALTAACASDYAPAHKTIDTVDHNLDGTFLKGFSIHGAWLQMILDEGLPRARAYYDKIPAFYNATATNFETEYKLRDIESSLDHSKYDYAMVVSDDHCNVGNYRVEKKIAEKFKPFVVINGGDLTNSGEPFEEECVTAQADDLAQDQPEVLAGGNHDSPISEDQARKHGMVILHTDKLEKIHGYRIQGEDDVNESVFGSSIRLRGKETIQDETDRVTKAACKNRPNILVVHEPEMVAPAVQEGCTSISISGHLHAFHVNKYMNSIQFINGTSGGAKQGQITFAELKQDAEVSIIAFDKTTKQPVGYFQIWEHTDKTVTISDLIPFNVEPVANPSKVPLSQGGALQPVK